MDSFSNLQNLFQKGSQNGSSSKMSPAFSIVQMEKISEPLSKHWMNSGMAFHGEYLMQNISEHPKDAEESTLLEVLETSCQLKYFLTKKHLKSLLTRAKAKKHPLPKDLEKAIKKQLSILSSMPQLEENIQQARKQKAIEMMGKHTLSIPEAARMLFVRRLTPSECEILQGFPQGWTAIDIAQ